MAESHSLMSVSTIRIGVYFKRAIEEEGGRWEMMSDYHREKRFPVTFGQCPYEQRVRSSYLTLGFGSGGLVLCIVEVARLASCCWGWSWWERGDGE